MSMALPPDTPLCDSFDICLAVFSLLVYGSWERRPQEVPR